MSFNIRKKFSKKFIKNIEKSYRSVTNEEDIYYTYSSPNKNTNMTSNQNISPQMNNPVTNDTSPMEIETSTSTHALSNSEQDISSHDLNKNDSHIQTPITEESTFMDKDPIEPNTNKEKSPENESNTQNVPPNTITITVLIYCKNSRKFFYTKLFLLKKLIKFSLGGNSF
jgi:hypothetical protein